jgi:hypothetical protein
MVAENNSNRRGHMNREGFYAIHYGAGTTTGMGMIVLDAGLVVGCDPSGTTYDGTYEFNSATGMLDATVVMKLAPGAKLVTGIPAGALPPTVTIMASVPRDLGAKAPAYIDIPGGRIGVVFHKLRDFPN